MGDLINGRTPEQIKAAATHCIKSSACFAGECPYFDSNNCNMELLRDVMDYVSSLEHPENPKEECR